MKIDGKTSHNSPSLRFPEFTGEWVLNEMWNIAPLQRGFDLPSGNVLDGTIPVVYSNGILRYHNDYKCKAPAVITGRSGTIGKFTYLDKGYYWPHNTTLWVTDFCHNNPKFIYYLYQTINISQFATGSGVPTLNRNDVHRHRCYLPKSIDEQRKIAAFLSLIDERIAIQDRLIDRLQSLMKGIRHRIINEAKGKIVCLCEVSDIYQPQTISSADLTETGYPVYGANGIIGHYTSYNHEAEQVCITCRGNTCGGVNYTKSKSWITGNAMVVNVDRYQNIVSKRYLYHYLSNCDFNSIISGSGQPQIVRAPLAKFKIILPTVMQQYKIAHCLDVIQNKINVNSNILNLIIRQKQYLLRKMFI